MRRTTKFTIQIYYTHINDHCDQYNYTEAQRANQFRGTAAHEIGHALGLNDNPPYTGTTPIMSYNVSYHNDYGPRKPDIAGAYRFN